MTATVSPGSAPGGVEHRAQPVVTPQPISAARSSGMSSSLIFTTAFSCTSICSAKDDRSRNWFIGLAVACESRAAALRAAGRRVVAQRHAGR
jgi:hypothetical protein